MADFNTAFAAQAAMRKSVESIFADASLNEQGRVDVLLKNAEDYAEHVGVPLDHARGFVAKVASEAGSAPEIIRKVAAKDEEPTLTPNPVLFGPITKPQRKEPLRRASATQMLKLAQGGLAAEVAKLRAEQPGLTEHAARKRIFAEDPGFYSSLVKLQRGANEEITKRGEGPAAAEFMAKVEAIQKAEPSLTGAQAYTKAYTDPDNAPIVKRMKTEQRGEG